MQGFWKELPRPCFVLAPMVGVTDAAFRRVIARYGKPHVMWTEFISADGLCSRGRDALLHDLWFTEIERPIVAQLYGGNPDNMREAARFCIELGYDGIDINMGCPDRVVEKHGAGSILIKRPQLAQELVLAAREGAGEHPVSVKTRIGYHENQIESWLASLIQAGPAAITIHARTRDDMSKVPARWDVIERSVQIAREVQPDAAKRPLILGNGDIRNLHDAREIAAETGCDGVMIGRGIFGDPWLFNPELERAELPFARIIEVMLEHTELYCELFGEIKPFEPMKKHFKAYVNGFRGAAELRERMMAAVDLDEVRQLAHEAIALESASR
ncbi:tRNA-dihydrouridine synthase [bacterium]|nr:tRNA-dihydrouridine synthase [bacterium]